MNIAVILWWNFKIHFPLLDTSYLNSRNISLFVKFLEEVYSVFYIERYLQIFDLFNWIQEVYSCLRSDFIFVSQHFTTFLCILFTWRRLHIFFMILILSCFRFWHFLKMTIPLLLSSNPLLFFLSLSLTPLLVSGRLVEYFYFKETL